MVIITHLKSILAYKRWTLLFSSYQPNKTLWNVFIETAKYIWWQKYTKYIISSYVVSLVKKIIQWKVKYSSVKIVYAYSLLSWSTTLPVRQCTALLLPCCLRTFSDWVLKVTPLHWMCKKALPSSHQMTLLIHVGAEVSADASEILQREVWFGAERCSIRGRASSSY